MGNYHWIVGFVMIVSEMIVLIAEMTINEHKRFQIMSNLALAVFVRYTKSRSYGARIPVLRFRDRGQVIETEVEFYSDNKQQATRYLAGDQVLVQYAVGIDGDYVVRPLRNGRPDQTGLEQAKWVRRISGAVFVVTLLLFII